jgi:hypothetical protein
MLLPVTAATQYSPRARSFNGSILLEVVALMAAAQHSPRAQSTKGRILLEVVVLLAVAALVHIAVVGLLVLLDLDVLLLHEAHQIVVLLPAHRDAAGGIVVPTTKILLTFIPMFTYILVYGRVLWPKHILISFLFFKTTYSWSMGKKARNLEQAVSIAPKFPSPVHFVHKR